MREMELRRIDLNLLVVLRVLLDTRSVTRTAERLNMSQPAVSRALGKLRVQLDDKLLVKSASGMTTTARAEGLSEPLTAALRQLESLVAKPQFDPKDTGRVFRVATTDYGAIVVLPRLMPQLLAAAPKAELEVVPFSNSVFAQLYSGQIDVALYSDDPVPDALKTRSLFVEGYSCLMRADHPLLSKKGLERRHLTLDEFIEWPHALVSISGGRTGQVDEALAKIGRERRVALWLPYFAAASLVTAASDLIVTLPTRVACTLAINSNLALLDAPLSVEGFGYRMLWHERSQNDLGAVWLRELIALSV